MSRRRVWVEHLPLEELGRPATVALLVRYGLEPIVALPPGKDGPAAREALAALARAGVPIGVWPLLDDADGYWLSTRNTDAFLARIEALLAWLAEIPVRSLAIDLEPPLEITRALERGERVRPFVDALGGRAFRAARDQRSAARVRLGAALASYRARGLETIAAVLPPLVLDLEARHRPLQALFATPLDPSACDVVCPMMYTTMIAPLLPWRGQELTRWLLDRAARRLVARRGAARVSVGLGLVGRGKLGDEPIYAEVEELSADVETATAAGATDLALFSLEGVLGRERPEAWLEAYAGLRSASSAPRR